MRAWRPRPDDSSSSAAAPRVAPGSHHNAVPSTACDTSLLAATHQLRFRKADRLVDAAAFGRVFKKATRSRDKMFTVLSRDNEAGHARLGLAISKKYCRRATQRNRLKRIIRESFRQHRNRLEGLDIVVMNRPEAAGASNPELFTSLEKHWHQCAARKQGGSKQE